MKTLNVEVKSKGQVLGDVNVQEFVNVAEAVEYFEAQAAGEGEKRVLTLLNAQHRANICNAERVAKTRPTSPMKALRERVKTDPNAKKALEAMLAQFGITGDLSF